MFTELTDRSEIPPPAVGLYTTLVPTHSSFGRKSWNFPCSSFFFMWFRLFPQTPSRHIRRFVLQHITHRLGSTQVINSSGNGSVLFGCSLYFTVPRPQLPYPQGNVRIHTPTNIRRVWTDEPWESSLGGSESKHQPRRRDPCVVL